MAIDERWQQTDQALEAEITCDDFMAAVELINRIAAVAEELNHHPDLYIHDFKHLRISLRSHDSGGISERDHNLAAAIDELLQ